MLSEDSLRQRVEEAVDIILAAGGGAGAQSAGGVAGSVAGLPELDPPPGTAAAGGHDSMSPLDVFNLAASHVPLPVVTSQVGW